MIEQLTSRIPTQPPSVKSELRVRRRWYSRLLISGSQVRALVRPPLNRLISLIYPLSSCPRRYLEAGANNGNKGLAARGSSRRAACGLCYPSSGGNSGRAEAVSWEYPSPKKQNPADAGFCR